MRESSRLHAACKLLYRSVVLRRIEIMALNPSGNFLDGISEPVEHFVDLSARDNQRGFETDSMGVDEGSGHHHLAFVQAGRHLVADLDVLEMLTDKQSSPRNSIVDLGKLPGEFFELRNEVRSVLGRQLRQIVANNHPDGGDGGGTGHGISPRRGGMDERIGILESLP